MDAETTGGMDWGTWAAGIGEKLITATIDAKVTYPQQNEQLRINKLGSLGYYSEGLAGVSGGAVGLSPLVLIGGAALLVYLLVKA